MAPTLATLTTTTNASILIGDPLWNVVEGGADCPGAARPRQEEPRGALRSR